MKKDKINFKIKVVIIKMKLITKVIKKHLHPETKNQSFQINKISKNCPKVAILNILFRIIFLYLRMIKTIYKCNLVKTKNLINKLASNKARIKAINSNYNKKIIQDHYLHSVTIPKLLVNKIYNNNNKKIL